MHAQPPARRVAIAVAVPPTLRACNGWRMHYVDEGSGDPVVLLHGNPTWGFLYREVIPPLVASGYRVIVPDMIGFGLSEKPTREHAHTLDGHSANLVALLRQLDLKRVTLVCHDWGGPTGLSAALSNLERMRALVVMSTWAWPRTASRVPHPHLSLAHHARAPGRAVPARRAQCAGGTRRLSVGGRSRIASGRARKPRTNRSSPIRRRVCSRGPGRAGSRSTIRLERAPVFAGSSSVCGNADCRSALIWGREDEVFDAATFAARFKKLLPHAEGPHMVTGRHFLQEDSGPEIAAIIIDFLGRLPAERAS